ncbi:glycoside hydrolase domain-containing protein [Streptomyces sp. NPDC005393]
MTLCTPGPDGMTGHDDLGTMSAWYVFSSLGLCPTMSGGDFLALSSPRFASAVVRIGHYGTRRGVSLNGRDVARTWLGRGRIAHGRVIAHRLSTEPSSWGTSPGAEPPSVGGAHAH